MIRGTWKMGQGEEKAESIVSSVVWLCEIITQSLIIDYMYHVTRKKKE